MKPLVTPADVPPWGPPDALAVMGSLLSGRINRGRGPRHLEDIIGGRIGATYVKAVNSCRTAIGLALRGLGIDGGDEVVLPSYVCQSALDPVLGVGATPIFVDCGTDLQMSVPDVERAITPRTRAILAPHLFGASIEIERLESVLEDTEIALVDDAAQSFGATRSGRYLGSFGSCGVVSCAPSKALSGSGGGLLITNDARLAEGWDSESLGMEPSRDAVRRVLRLWFWLRFARLTAPLKKAEPGGAKRRGSTKSHRTKPRRMGHLDATIALKQLARLADGEERRLMWSTVAEAVGGRVDGEVIDASPEGVPRNVVVILEEGARRVDVLERFRRAGIEARPGYSPLHLSGGPSNRDLPVTERLWRRVVVVPIGNADRTAEAIRGG